MEHKGCTIWFTGLSGAGKSTITDELVKRLKELGMKVEVLDGDVVRTHLSKGLGFSKEDRDTNILRIGWVCEVLTRNNVIAIAAAISPYREIRDKVRKMVGPNFIEVYAAAPLEECEKRDVKGLYKKARAGEIKQFTGIDDPYEAPLNPEVVCDTHKETLDQSVDKVLAALRKHGILNAKNVPVAA